MESFEVSWVFFLFIFYFLFFISFLLSSRCLDEVNDDDDGDDELGGDAMIPGTAFSGCVQGVSYSIY